MDDIHGRRDERVPLRGALRLLVKSHDGFLVGAGEIIDLSAHGCAIRVQNRSIEPDLTGRIDVAIAGVSLSLPIVTRWVRAERDGYAVGYAFDDLTPEDNRAVHALLRENTGLFI